MIQRLSTLWDIVEIYSKSLDETRMRLLEQKSPVVLISLLLERNYWDFKEISCDSLPLSLFLSYLPSSPCFSSESLPTSFLGAQNKPSILPLSLSLSCKAPFYCWPLRHTPQKNTHFQIMTPACQDLSQRCQLSFRETEIIWKDIVEISRDKEKREVKGREYRSGKLRSRAQPSFQKSSVKLKERPGV